MSIRTRRRRVTQVTLTKNDDNRDNADFGYITVMWTVEWTLMDWSTIQLRNHPRRKRTTSPVETPPSEQIVESRIWRDDEDILAPNDDGQFDFLPGYDDEPLQKDERAIGESAKRTG